MPSIKRTIDVLIYLSVAFGMVLLLQLYVLVPRWLFYSVLTGWVAYVAVAILAAAGRKVAYPLAFILSILTLAVSLPQPEHYSLVQEGFSLASATFLAGSVLQVLLLILLLVYFIRSRSAHRAS